MEISISETNLLVEMKDVESAPIEVQKLAEEILNLNWVLRVLLNKRAREDYKIQSISKAEQILNSIFADFISFFQSVSDLLDSEGNKDISKKLLNDLINLRKEISQETHQLIARPSEKIYTKYWSDVDTLISKPVHSLILPPLIAGWNISRQEIGFSNVECDLDQFYSAFHKKVLSLIGQFPMVQVFKAPIKTVGLSATSPAELRNQMLGVFEELKMSEKNKEELRKNIPPELVKDFDTENEEIIEEDTEEIGEDEG